MLQQQVWNRIRIGKQQECWPWIGKSKNEHGYGIINYDGKTQKAHRIAYQLFYSCKLTSYQHLMHQCDNPSCCNPHHLKIGSQTRNIHDCISKNRNSAPPIRYGENNNTTKITRQDVKEIRSLYESGNFTTLQLAQMFGLNSKTSISNIIKGKTWRWL